MDTSQTHVGDLQDAILVIISMQTRKPKDVVGLYVAMPPEKCTVVELVN